jgi:putative ABC transport system ATP-binding protein
VSVDGIPVSDLAESKLVGFRRERIGFIFQTFGLLPILSAAENVEVPLRLVRADPRAREERVREVLTLVGLADRADHRPHELSGGEQQRVAIARALANRPDLLLADEPTGQLDSQTGRSIMALLQHLVRTEALTAMVATHDKMLIELADQVIELQDGHVVKGDQPAA